MYLYIYIYTMGLDSYWSIVLDTSKVPLRDLLPQTCLCEVQVTLELTRDSAQPQLLGSFFPTPPRGPTKGGWLPNKAPLRTIPAWPRLL